MKKLLFIAIITFFTFTLSACVNNNIDSNTIVNAELTDRERGILSTTSNQSFVFDFHVDSVYKEASVWVEKYEFGKLVDEKIGYLTTKVMNNGSIILTTFESNAIDNQTWFNIGINSDGGISSATTSTIVSTKGTDGRSIVWGNISEEMDVTNEGMVLASIGYSWDEGPMSSFSSEFYRDVARHISELENYEVVYLFRSKFTKLNGKIK